MKTQVIRYAFLLLLCALLGVIGAQAQKGKPKINADATVATANSANATGQCKTPKPPNRGCKITCKPCQVPVCENGKWQYENIEIDKEQCRPHPNDDGGVCTIGTNEYCPPSCKKCIRQ
ncbi:MAG: hypothetical protein HYR56_24605 [Acidobacteria bacterium]|nr:hypothetical protein [Acidobacteriota bacterium]MBI3422083.1 hypothetical protein [Acidobacteriota bacterium]